MVLASALVAIAFLLHVGHWYTASGAVHVARRVVSARHDVSPRQVVTAVGILLALLFSKFIYRASFSSYYTFYLISRFHVSVQSAQVHLFLFFGAVAAGTIIGGPVGDRIGRRQVIVASILGVLPFTLALPYASLLGRACSPSSSASCSHRRFR